VGLLFDRIIEVDSECGTGIARFAMLRNCRDLRFQKGNYKTSQDIGNSLFKQIEESGVDYVVTDCETCKWQIEMSTSKCCKHPISVLAEMLQD